MFVYESAIQDMSMKIHVLLYLIIEIFLILKKNFVKNVRPSEKKKKSIYCGYKV